MKQYSFLHTFCKPPLERARLVVIPSSCSVSKPPIEYYSDKVEKQHLQTLALEKHVTLVLPYDDNIFCGRWYYDATGADYTHAPQTRAAMLFEAIQAKNTFGHFKYTNIYLTEGCGSLELIEFFKALTASQPPLPQRANTLKIYGFDDARHLQTYLGKKGICTPVFYSKGLKALLTDLSYPTAGACALKALNVAARAVQYLSGYLMPDTLKISHISDKNYPQKNTIFIISELDTITDFQACQKWAFFGKYQIAFILSRDTSEDKTTSFIQSIPHNIPIFSGAPVGHGACLNNGKPITLFSSAILSTPADIPILSWADTSNFKIAA